MPGDRRVDSRLFSRSLASNRAGPLRDNRQDPPISLGLVGGDIGQLVPSAILQEAAGPFLVLAAPLLEEKWHGKSFAFGNANIENERVTREMAAKAAELLPRNE